ncbi:MAG: M23 family metallopeptidase [Polyangiaceae bacterium]
MLHSDGTVGLYMHLSKPSVKAGDALEQGDVIGKSGNSGWSTGPHLHVQVQQNCGIWWCQSVPLSFVEVGKPGKGQSVTSDNCP